MPKELNDNVPEKTKVTTVRATIKLGDMCDLLYVISDNICRNAGYDEGEYDQITFSDICDYLQERKNVVLELTETKLV